MILAGEGVRAPADKKNNIIEIMKLYCFKWTLKGFAFSCIILFSTLMARAVPYASGVTNNGSTVYFILNEDADNVKVVLDGATTNNLGALAKGTRSFSLGSATTFSIMVTKNAPYGWTQISSDTNQLCAFYTPRGIAVNIFPTNTAYFGRVYVSTALSGFAAATFPRQTGDGIYLMNADLSDALARGNTPSNPGLNFAPSDSTYTPYRLEVGPDNNLYIGDYSVTTGTIYLTDPDVTTNVFVLAGQGTSSSPNANTAVHTTIAGHAVSGSIAAGNLIVWQVDGNFSGGGGNLLKYNIGAGPLPWGGVPDVSSSAGAVGVPHIGWDCDISRDGQIVYTSFYRLSPPAGSNLKVFDSTGTKVWDSITDGAGGVNTSDPFMGARGIKLSPDGNTLAAMVYTNTVTISPLTNNGVGQLNPDVSRIYSIPTFPASPSGTSTSAIPMDISWDAAGNLYAYCEVRQFVRVFSPGGNSTAITGGDRTGTNGSFSVSIAPAPDPSLLVQPQNQSTTVGGSATFSVVANGTGPFSYQWNLNGSPISGATTNTYTKTGAVLADSGSSYTVLVQGPSSSILSSVAVLRVDTGAPNILLQPQTITTNASVNVTFTAGVTGTPQVTYQWKFNGANISGQTTNTLIRTNVQLATFAGAYTVFVSNSVGTALSAPANLNIIEGPPIITSQPVSLTNNAGTNPKFTVTAVGSDTRLFQWQLNGTNIPGATTTAYTRNDCQQNTAGPYRVLVGNNYGIVTSDVATLTVTDTDPIITSQTLSKTVSAGSNVVLTVTTTGQDPRTYQWYVDYGTGAAVVAGATNSSMTITNAQVPDSATYYAQITNPRTTLTSTNIALTVNATSVTFITQPKSQSIGTGGDVTFTTSVFGDTNLVFQWSRNGTIISGATNTSLVWTNSQNADNAASYTVQVVQNGSTTIASTNAVLTVTNKAPTIITAPTNFAGLVNGKATNTVVAQGQNTLSYQWFFNSTTTNAVAGATAATLVLTNLQTANAGSYTVVVTDGNSLSTTSAVALLAVTAPVAPGTGQGLKGEYFADLYFSNTPASFIPNSPFSFTNAPSLTRIDTNIDFSWATGSPDAAAIPTPDFFLARWTGQIQPLYSETYTFSTKSDDGARLWINDQLVIDKFVSGGNQNYTAVVSNLVAGQKYDVRMEYCDITSTAEVHLLWQSSSQLKEAVEPTQLYSNSGPYVLWLTPTNAVGNSSGPATLNVYAGGSAPLAYQWTHFGTNVPGATASTLTFNSLQLSDAGSYNVIVSNSYSSVTSPVPAFLYVQVPSTTGTGTGLTGEYYSNHPQTQNAPMVITNSPTLTRIDPTIDFLWGVGEPDVSISNDKFAVRWSGQIQPLYSQVYNFYTRTDDGTRLWVDGQLLIDKWVNQSPTEWTATMPYSLTAGQKYNIVMEYYENGSGAEAHLFWSSLSQPKAIVASTQLYTGSGPTITVQPVDVSTNVGSNAVFTVRSVGTGPIAYQWKKAGVNLSNGGNISGATSTNLTIASIQNSDTGTYSVAVTNALGFAISTNVVLSLNAVAPAITTQPQSQTADQGTNVTFTVVASGTQPSYQWTFNSGNIPNATNSSLLLSSVQPADAGTYSVIVSNAVSSVTSSNALLTIRPHITSSVSGNTLTLTWTGAYTVQTSTNVAGPYADISGSSPYTIDVSAGPQRYYRLRQ